MRRVVLDTNVLVSALINRAGKPGRVLDMALEGAVQIAISPAILAEYENVLGRGKFPFTRETVRAVIDRIRDVAGEVTPLEAAHASSGPADDKFLECATAAGADAVITGNTRHFPKRFRDVRILTPAEALDEMEGRHG